MVRAVLTDRSCTVLQRNFDQYGVSIGWHHSCFTVDWKMHNIGINFLYSNESRTARTYNPQSYGRVQLPVAHCHLLNTLHINAHVVYEEREVYADGTFIRQVLVAYAASSSFSQCVSPTATLKWIHKTTHGEPIKASHFSLSIFHCKTDTVF